MQQIELCSRQTAASKEQTSKDKAIQVSPISEPNENDVNNDNDVIKLKDLIKAVKAVNPSDVNNSDLAGRLSDVSEIDVSHIKKIDVANDMNNSKVVDRVSDANSKKLSVNNKISDVNNNDSSTREELPVLNFCNSTEFKNKDDPNAIEKVDI